MVDRISSVRRVCVTAARRTEVIGDATLYLGDCMEIMPSLQRVDAIIADPPYGVDFAEWDGARPPDAFFDLIRKKAPTAAVHTVQGEIWGWPRPDWVMAWFMPGSVNRTRGGKFRHWEPVLIYGEECAKVDSRVFPPIGGERCGHPCPKPDAVTRWLVGEFAEEGQTILDPFMGSGTTGVACMRLSRKFIGIEIHEPYFDIACRRIDKEYRRGDFMKSERGMLKTAQTALLPTAVARPRMRRTTK